jgi:hypothetical protein
VAGDLSHDSHEVELTVEGQAGMARAEGKWLGQLQCELSYTRWTVFFEVFGGKPEVHQAHRAGRARDGRFFERPAVILETISMVCGCIPETNDGPVRVAQIPSDLYPTGAIELLRLTLLIY